MTLLLTRTRRDRGKYFCWIRGRCYAAGGSVARMSRLRLTLRANFYVEDDQWIGFCPDLNVSTQANTREEAEVNLHEAVGLFIETCADLGSLQKVLREAGLIPT